MRHHRGISKLIEVSFFIAVTLVLVNCAPKATKTTTREEYKEDLSAIRPPIDSVGTEAKVEKVKAPYQKPENDVTRNLNSVIDSLTKDNRNKRVNVYTIQVYVGSSREEANEARSKVYRALKEETPKLEYSAPNYRVKVGSFVDRVDAHKTLTVLKKSFPGAILLDEKVYLKN